MGGDIKIIKVLIWIFVVIVGVWVLAVLVLQALNQDADTRVSLVVDSTAEVHEIDDSYLSFAIDFAQIIGKDWWDPSGKKVSGISGTFNVDPFDFDREELVSLARDLGPVIVSYGGTKSDQIMYFNDDEHALSKKHVDDMFLFANEIDAEVALTLNASRHMRLGDGSLDSKETQKLFSYIAEKGYDTKYVALGNEPNGYILDGLGSYVSSKQYTDDYRNIQNNFSAQFSGIQFLAPNTAFFPVVGDVFPFTKRVVGQLRSNLDVLSWHYYPQQSNRCVVKTRRAQVDTLLNPQYLDELEDHASYVQEMRNEFSPQAELWLSETGNAQCGGEKGISDSFVSSLWWIDQLALLAQFEHDHVIRQTLTGSDYGMIDNETLQPRPDYWASVLWKKIIGKKVYSQPVASDYYVRAYHHELSDSMKEQTGKEDVLILINLSTEHEKEIEVDISNELLFIDITADSLQSEKVSIAGNEIDTIEDIESVLGEPQAVDSITLKKTSYSFIMY